MRQRCGRRNENATDGNLKTSRNQCGAGIFRKKRQPGLKRLLVVTSAKIMCHGHDPVPLFSSTLHGAASLSSFSLSVVVAPGVLVLV
jgi:hypothetical protein